MLQAGRAELEAAGPSERAARHGDAGPRLLAAPGRPGPRTCEGSGGGRARVAGLREQQRADQQREETPSSRGRHCLPPHSVIFLVTPSLSGPS